MAIYNFKNKAKKEKVKKDNSKLVGWTLITLSLLVYILLLSNLIPGSIKFSLSLMGFFAYPFFIFTFILGLAFLNKKKYVMPKRYAVFVSLFIFSVICLIQTIHIQCLIPAEEINTYSKYICANYNAVYTLGGAISGFFVANIQFLTGSFWWAIVIFFLLGAFSLAIIIDCWRQKRIAQNLEKPLQVRFKEKEESVPKTATPTLQQTQPSQSRMKDIENGIMATANIQDEISQNEEREENAGLSQTMQVGEKVSTENMTREELKHFLLTPSKVNLEELFPDRHKFDDEQTLSADEETYSSDTLNIEPEIFVSGQVKADTIIEPDNNNNIIEEMHEESCKINPNFVVHEDKLFHEPKSEVKRTSLPEVSASDLTLDVDTLMHKTIEEERQKNSYFTSGTKSSESSSWKSLSGIEGENVIKEDNGRDTQRDFNGASFDREGDVRSEGQFLRGDNRQSLAKEGLDRMNIQQTRENEFTSNPFESGRKVWGRGEDDIVSNPTTMNRAGENQLRPNFLERMSPDDVRQRERFITNDEITANVLPNRNYESEKENKPYVYTKPPLSLITTKSDDLSFMAEEVTTKKVILENNLETFDIPAKVKAVLIGPAVTRYELEMPIGVPVTKVKNRADDIAMALSANGAVRIEAPVPGKSVVGIEVPNRTIGKVSLRDILASREFNENPSPLCFALGRDITGRVLVGDLKKLRHVLIAGTTGSGKSVCLNSIILSIIYKASPSDVRIMLIDPKRVEFSSYAELPHLITPRIINDPKVAVNALSWAVAEMEKRYEMLEHARVRSIEEFNSRESVKIGKEEKMPYLVIIVDELNDLMMNSKKECEDKIIKLAQKARAAGIHLILATQKPTVDVITGLIKSNIPSRIAFRVTSSMDSMTILQSVGAEKLLGRGDMLYLPEGAPEGMRVQGCYVETNEINDIVDFAKENNETIFDEEIEQLITNPSKLNAVGNKSSGNEIDPLFVQALKLCIENKQASITMLRRKFAMGYPKAASLVDHMEELGYVTPADGVKGRTVLITMEEFEEIYGDVDY